MSDPQDSPKHAVESHTGRRIGRKIGSAIGGAVDLAVGTVEQVGEVLLSPMRLAGLGRPEQEQQTTRAPGARPGIEHAAEVDNMPSDDGVHIDCIDYNEDKFERRAVKVSEFADFLATPKPEWAAVRWINIDGLHPWVVNQVRLAFDYHTLAAEDTMHVPQRPKVEGFDGYLFVVARMLSMHTDGLMAEQTSYYLSEGQIVSFQETHGDVWEPIRQRIANDGSRLRKRGGGYLFYALIDAVVDHCFPILEQYGNMLEDLELEALDDPSPAVLHRIHGIKRQLVTLRRIMWPMREMLDYVARDEEAPFSDYTRNYLRDVYDHAIQVIDIIETYREMAGGLTDLYMSAVSNKMNEVMKVLTIMASLFIPITFIAGVFGMNFAAMPELEWGFMYPWAFWTVCGACVIGMLVYFRRRGWLGG